MIRVDRRVRWSLLLVLVLVAAGGAAMSPSGDPRGASTRLAARQPAPSSVRSGNAPAAPDGFTVWTPRWVSGDPLLVPRWHPHPGTSVAGTGEAALQALLDGGSTGQRCLPEGTRLRGLAVEGTTAVVDFSAAVLTAPERPYSAQCLAWTLTGLDGIEQVQVTVEGRSSGMVNGRDVTRLWGGDGVARPLRRDRSVPPAPIVVTTPRPDAQLTGGAVAVGGSASVPGGQLGLRLRDGGGQLVAQQFTTASAAAPERGRFSARLRYRAPAGAATWTLQVFVVNRADGSVGYLVEIPVRVLPEGR